MAPSFIRIGIITRIIRENYASGHFWSAKKIKTIISNIRFTENKEREWINEN